VIRDWKARGYDCRPFVDPPGQEWNNFVHQTNELVTVAEGRLEMTVASQRFMVEPGDEVFIPKGVVHSVKNSNNVTTRWFFGYD
jgi:quercetin dioxygenase-like cupin family protein